MDNWKFDISVFQKEENKYIYIPATSGHQQHTINDFILGESRRYVRFDTLEKKIIKIKRKIFIRSRNRGYKKVFLSRLFSKIKSRNKLLTISADNENYRETGNKRSDTILVNEAEHMFQMTFSEEEIPVENNHANNVHTCSIPSLSSLYCKSKVSCWYYLCCYKWQKKIWKHFFFFGVSPFFVLLLFRKQILLIKSIWLFPDLYCLSRRK